MAQIVQTAQGSAGSSGGTITVSFGTVPAAGNLIVFARGKKSWEGTSAAPTGMTQLFAHTQPDVAFDICTAVGDGTTNGWTYIAADYSCAVAFEVNEAQTPSSAPVYESADTATGVGPAATTTTADMLALALATDNGGALTAAAGWSAVNTPPQSNCGIFWATPTTPPASGTTVNPEWSGGWGNGYIGAVLLIAPTPATPVTYYIASGGQWQGAEALVAQGGAWT